MSFPLSRLSSPYKANNAVSCTRPTQPWPPSVTNLKRCSHFALLPHSCRSFTPTSHLRVPFLSRVQRFFAHSALCHQPQASLSLETPSPFTHVSSTHISSKSALSLTLPALLDHSLSPTSSVALTLHTFLFHARLVVPHPRDEHCVRRYPCHSIASL